MSAIDTTFTWVRNPTILNSLATTYVSKRGSDVSGDGTAQNPYASLAKATSVATSGTNIMLDDGEWNEARTENGRSFNWWGNGKTNVLNLNNINEASFNSLYLYNNIIYSGGTTKYYNCIVIKGRYNSSEVNSNEFFNCIIIDRYPSQFGSWIDKYNNCILLKSENNYSLKSNSILKNCFIYMNISTYNPLSHNNNGSYNNISNGTNINDATTGQTLADYFNYVHPNILANPSTATIDDWLKCDFTAKEGSKNIGAGEKGSTIGLNQGYTMYADNSANDMFSQSNGAILKNIEWNSTLNGYTLIQKDRVCAGATTNTITLDSNASSVDDYYNNLFIGIVSGNGYGEIFKIIDYDGATKTATIDGIWNTTPNANSVYTISGTILSAIKDFGKAIKVKHNWTFLENFTTFADGRWVEFLTNLTSQGKELPVNCFLYEYSINGTNWIQGHTSDDLVSATDGENKIYDQIYGDCSPNYVEASANELVMRYIRINVHIGFNI